jgi:hypothetical protein
VKRFRPQIIVPMTLAVKMKGFAHFRMGEVLRRTLSKGDQGWVKGVLFPVEAFVDCDLTVFLHGDHAMNALES